MPNYKENFFKILNFFVSTLVFMKNVEEFVDIRYLKMQVTTLIFWKQVTNIISTLHHTF